MTVMDMKEQSGLNVSTSTIQKALHEKGLRSYREQWKFILDEENRKRRVRWCEAREAWTMEDWGHIGFTDEMSIEVGGAYGVSLVWREKSEKMDCGLHWKKKKKQCPTVMFLGYVLVTPAILYYI